MTHENPPNGCNLGGIGFLRETPPVVDVILFSRFCSSSLRLMIFRCWMPPSNNLENLWRGMTMTQLPVMISKGLIRVDRAPPLPSM